MQIIAGIVGALVVVLVLRAFIMSRESAVRSTTWADSGAVPLTEDSIREFLLRGRKIDAIKAYRELHRVDLRAAKRAVERLAEQMPPTP